LRFLIAEINYGGRVTDDKDVRLITSLLKKYFTPQVMEDNYTFSPSGIYYAPPAGSLMDVKNYINELPLEDDPEVFGLHPNANITFQQKTVKEFTETLLSMNPKSSDKGSGGVSNDDIVYDLAKSIENQINEAFGDGLKQKREGEMRSIDVFKAQEIDRFNKLIKIMKKSLTDLQRAIKGLVVMSIQLEKMYNSFLNKKVPDLWADNAYPSLKPLSSWVKDLCQRLEFMHKWVENDPPAYWISAFFFPQGSLIREMNNSSRFHDCCPSNLC
jgi:Dynein heavy chain.